MLLEDLLRLLSLLNLNHQVFYESTHRIIKALNQLIENIPKRKIMIARELTKIHETIYRGCPEEVLNQLEQDSLKGEFVIVIRSK